MKLYRGPKGKLVRRFGVNIFDTEKFDKLLKRRPYPPGQHGSQAKRGKQSEYGRQLVEKQKLKFTYGMNERQFRNFFKKAAQAKGAPGHNLMQALESRLDSVVYRSGFVSSRAQARQLVNHGHFVLNNKRADIPSILLKTGDVVSLKRPKQALDIVKVNLEDLANKAQMPWLSVDENNLSITFNRPPQRSEIPISIQEQLIVELYSR